MTREEQIAAKEKSENVTTTTGNAIINNVISVAEKVEENKIEVPVEEPVVHETEVQDTVVSEELPAKEPEITATTSSESQMNFDPDVKLSDVIPISLDGIDLGSTSTATVDEVPSVETSVPLETTDVNMFNAVPSVNPWEIPKENPTPESSSFINNEPSFDNKEQFLKPYEPSTFEPSNESDKILKFIESTRKVKEKQGIARYNALTTNPEIGVEVNTGFFKGYSFYEALERSNEFIYNIITAYGITNDQLKDVNDKEPLHSSTRERNEVVFKLNRGEISTDEFPGFSNKFSKQDTETNFTDQQDKIIPFSGNNYEMQQVDTYGNIVNMPGNFGDNDQNFSNDFDNNKPFAA